MHQLSRCKKLFIGFILGNSDMPFLISPVTGNVEGDFVFRNSNFEFSNLRSGSKIELNHFGVRRLYRCKIHSKLKIQHSLRPLAANFRKLPSKDDTL